MLMLNSGLTGLFPFMHDPFFYFIILLIALIFDSLMGELQEKIHPTAWIGSLINFLEPKLRINNEKFGGFLLALIVLSIFVFPVHFLLSLAWSFHPISFLLVGSFVMQSTFAIKSMEEHAMPIVDALKHDDLKKARKKASLLVSRDTSILDRKKVASASIESVGENTCDGVISPIFFFFFFGIPAAVAFRAVDTLDSMIGYDDSHYRNFGWFSAKLDTLFNFVPARLTALLMIIAARILRENWKSSARFIVRDGDKTQSTNSGYPISATAGALKVRLEKPGHYVLGSENAPPSFNHICRSLRIMKVSVYLFAILISAIIIGFLLMG